MEFSLSILRIIYIITVTLFSWINCTETINMYYSVLLCRFLQNSAKKRFLLIRQTFQWVRIKEKCRKYNWKHSKPNNFQTRLVYRLTSHRRRFLGWWEGRQEFQRRRLLLSSTGPDSGSFWAHFARQSFELPRWGWRNSRWQEAMLCHQKWSLQNRLGKLIF